MRARNKDYHRLFIHAGCFSIEFGIGLYRACRVCRVFSPCKAAGLGAALTRESPSCPVSLGKKG